MIIKKTCCACPTQWEGHLDNGKFIYFRYRSGHLVVDLADNSETCEYGTGDTTVWENDYRFHRGYLDGVMKDDEVFSILTCLFNEKIKVESKCHT